MDNLEKNWLSTLKVMAKAPLAMKVEGFESRFIKHLARQESRNISRLWQAFTQERGEIVKGMLASQADVVAYLLGFHLPNAHRMLELCKRVDQRYDLKSYFSSLEAIELIDLACGTGALSQGFLASYSFQPERVSLYLNDIKKRLLAAASSIHSEQKHVHILNRPVETVRFGEFGKKSPAVFLLGYVWNELGRNPKAQRVLMNGLFAASQRESLVYLLEPANKGLAFAAMELRNTLVEMGYTPLYPCPHKEPCPLLAQGRKDYCYSEFSWAEPAFMTPIDKELKVSRRLLGCASYVFASPSLFAKLRPARIVKEVVVGNPRHQDDKAKADFLLCTEPGEIKRVVAEKRRLRGAPL